MKRAGANPFGGPEIDRPSIYTIAPGAPFVDALAAGVLARSGDDPLALARTTVLLPTRRACRALRDAFLRQSGGRATLLPRLQPIGDIDEDELTISGFEEPQLPESVALPPAISEMRRRLLLASMIVARPAPRTSADQAVWLAADLARLLDQVQTERLSFDGLDGLAPAEHAEHWQEILEFLKIVTENWPRILADEGCIDPAERRNRLLAAQAEAWRQMPPDAPVIAAGSTGSIPATADLLGVVARLPRGAVVLPGLDCYLDEEGWSTLAPSHPQYGLRQLLDRLEVSRDEVEDWDPGFAEGGNPMRRHLVAEAMRPAQTTSAWRDLTLSKEEILQGLDGLERIDCATPREEAGAIALIMREAVETPGRTAALVTPDRDLARRVAAELGRWGVGIDDSAGTPLAATPPGMFLGLVAALAEAEAAPVPLLAALKHPLAAGGMAPAVFRGRVRRLERAVLRGPRPAAGLEGVRRALTDEGVEAPLLAWFDGLRASLAPLFAAMARGRSPVRDLLEAHVAAAEALAASDQAAGAARLWAGDAGEAAAEFIADAHGAAAGFPEVATGHYPGLFAALLAGRIVRPQYGRHPRLQIWGLLEARLQHADVMILGGLNEGTWPPETLADPWMSRPMRGDFGLPLPERRIGLTAHDFSQAFCARRVVLTRAARVEGTPTVPSRWLLRLDAVLRRLGLAAEENGHALAQVSGSWLGWHHQLDRPTRFAPVLRPEPRPPVAARPRQLSVTQIETWLRDPYAIYARHVLHLRALDPLDADPGAAERGISIHEALERFVREHPAGLPDDALDRLQAIGRESFRAIRDRPGVWAFWWPRFERIAAWFVATQRERRAEVRDSIVEATGAIELAAPAGPFTLSARADRIDRRTNGAIEIIDYKTGAVPSRTEVESGRAPQLPLEAAIAARQGFKGIPRDAPMRLAYWRLTGGDPAGQIRLVSEDAAAAANVAMEGLLRLITAFDDEDTPYAAVPRRDLAPRYSDYDHLARIREWSAADGGEES